MTLVPDTFGSNSPLYEKLFEMILVPASPNPRANNAPIQLMVHSRISVSYRLYSFFFFFLKNFRDERFYLLQVQNFLYCFFSLSCLIYSKTSSRFSSSWAASRGFFAISFIFWIMSSIGPITKSFEILMKIIAPIARIRQTNMVRAIPNPPEILLLFHVSKIAR